MHSHKKSIISRNENNSTENNARKCNHNLKNHSKQPTIREKNYIFETQVNRITKCRILNTQITQKKLLKIEFITICFRFG